MLFIHCFVQQHKLTLSVLLFIRTLLLRCPEALMRSLEVLRWV